jgi:ketosteroid isomerase-like protein
VSQENVEILKASIAAWNERDMDAFRELHDPHVVVRMVEGWPEPGPFMGREAVMRQFEQLRDTWDADAMTDRRLHRSRRPRTRQDDLSRHGQGPQADLEMTQVVTVRKRKVVYRAYFWDHAEALEAVGLSKHDVHAGCRGVAGRRREGVGTALPERC